MVPRKVVEHAVRLLPLLVLPVVLAPVLTGLFVMAQPNVYESWTNIWVSEPSIGSVPLGAEDDEADPADRQAGVLSELLMTQEFPERVAERAGLMDTLDDELVLADGQTAEAARDEAVLQVVDDVRDSVTVEAVGTNLLSVTSEADTAEESQALVAGVLAEYEARLSEEAERQSTIAVEYFSNQLTIAEQDLAVRRAAVSAYVDEHPEVADPLTIDNPEFDWLKQSADDQAEFVTELRVSLQNAQLGAESRTESQAARFDVVDEPALPPTAQGASLVALASYGVAAVGLGVMISAGLLYVAVRTDHTVRSGEDLADVGAPMLGRVPHLKWKRTGGWLGWYQQRRETRRPGLTMAAPSEDGI